MNVPFAPGRAPNPGSFHQEFPKHAQLSVQSDTKAIGDPRLSGFISAYLGQTAVKLELSAEIEGILWEGAQNTRESGDWFGYGLMIEQLALATKAKRDFSSSEKLFEASVNIFRDIGDAWSLARASSITLDEIARDFL